MVNGVAARRCRAAIHNDRVALLRPYGIVLDGELNLGLEVLRENGTIVAIRPHTGVPDDYVLTVPFVNAHSHLEYRGLQGQIEGRDYWSWIRELTRRKTLQTEEEVRADGDRAAQENRRTGVGLIGEHSDRPFAGEALRRARIGGRIFQEVITLFEQEAREAKLRRIEAASRAQQTAFGGPAKPSPHALFTVDPETLRAFGESRTPISLHLAESTIERDFFERGEGPIAEFYRANGIAFEVAHRSPVAVAAALGLVRPGAQLVHVCDAMTEDIRTIAESGATVAHCPRSNENLGCPRAPIREYLDAGVAVGLGLDSAASSGPIDMFAEMRSALSVASSRGKPLSGDEVWRMATTMGARTLGFEEWDVKAGFTGPLLSLHVEDAFESENLIVRGTPEAVRWID